MAMERVGEEPRTDQLPPAVSPRLNVGVVVATFPNVLLPVKYGMFPMTAGDEVERPENPIVLPERVIGNVVEIVDCFPLKVVQSVEERQPNVEPFAVLQLKAFPLYDSPVPAVVVAPL